MYKREYGEPIIAIRMPAPLIAAAKIYARDHGTNLSAMMRELLTKELRSAGIDLTPKPLPGQMTIESDA